MKQINIVIKTLFWDISDNEINYTLDIFWSEYTDFNHKSGPFDGDDLILEVKTCNMGIAMCGIVGIIYHVQRCLVFNHIE